MTDNINFTESKPEGWWHIDPEKWGEPSDRDKRIFALREEDRARGAGQEADRLFFEEYPGCEYCARPLTPNELTIAELTGELQETDEGQMWTAVWHIGEGHFVRRQFFTTKPPVDLESAEDIARKVHGAPPWSEPSEPLSRSEFAERIKRMGGMFSPSGRWIDISKLNMKGFETTEDEPTGPVVEPLDLWGHFDPPALPRGVLPNLIERYAITMGELMGCDPAGLAMGALAVCSGMIRDSIKLQVKRNNDWTEEARLWCALVGGVSSMKSPGMRAVTRPVGRIDDRLWQQYQMEMAAYDALTPEERKTAEKPRLKQLRLEDTTIEGAQDTMRNNDNGMLAVQDELSAWFGGLEKYSGGGRGAAKDRGFWLLSWNGGSYTVNRVTRGAFRINNVGISLLGGIQPDVIREIATNTYDDGLIQRLLPVVLLPAKLGHDEPTAPVADEYEQLIEQLFKLTPGAVKGDPFMSVAYKLDGTAVLEFDDGAQVVRREMEQWHLELQKAFEVINKKLASHVGKYNGYFARLCITFHCIERPREVPNYISEGTAKRVAKFMQEFLFPHALSFYSGVLDLADDHETLSDIAGYILTHKPEQITNRDLARGSSKMKRLAKRDTDPVLEQLEAIGWVMRMPGRRVNDPPRWLVNPRVYERFAERAKEETERRAMVRGVMARLPKREPR